MSWVIYSKSTGEITRILSALNGPPENQTQVHEGFIESDISTMNCYVQNGRLVERLEVPSEFHKWDWPTLQWLPDLDAARSARQQEVTAELNRRLYLPCLGFDADPVSRERITGMIARLQRGDGLPPGWRGWRDADNEMRWADDDADDVLDLLIALARAIEDREQALLIASWQHKAAIAALTEIDAILGYDVTAGWPV